MTGRSSRQSETTSPDPYIGTEIGDVYRIVREVGSGYVGVVYEAEHIALDKRFAVKILHENYAVRPEARECFVRSASETSRLRHANIVQIVGHGLTAQGSAYVAMEWIEGETIESLLEREDRLPWSRAREIILQVTSALRKGHKRSICHRSLRPANCFVQRGPDGGERIKLTDFGLAAVGLARSDTSEVDPETFAIFGDTRYLAPEQALGGEVSVQSDIYALGAILHHMLTGAPPMVASNAFLAIRRRSAGEFTAPRERAPSIPLAVESILLRTLERDPDARYASVRDLEREMSAIPADARGDEPQARPAPDRSGPGAPTGGDVPTLAPKSIDDLESSLREPSLLISRPNRSSVESSASPVGDEIDSVPSSPAPTPTTRGDPDTPPSTPPPQARNRIGPLMPSLPARSAAPRSLRPPPPAAPTPTAVPYRPLQPYRTGDPPPESSPDLLDAAAPDRVMSPWVVVSIGVLVIGIAVTLGLVIIGAADR